MRIWSLCMLPLLFIAAASPAAAEGFRVELHTGLDRVSSGGNKESGLLYGMGVGYDLNSERGMFGGLELNAEDSGAGKCVTGDIVPGDKLCGHTERDISVVARVGSLVGPAGKIYGLAGYSNARTFLAYTSPLGVNTYTTKDLDGLRIGAGYEHRLSTRFYAKAEYRYSNYEDDVTRHQFIVGLGVTF